MSSPPSISYFQTFFVGLVTLGTVCMSPSQIYPSHSIDTLLLRFFASLLPSMPRVFSNPFRRSHSWIGISLTFFYLCWNLYQKDWEISAPDVVWMEFDCHWTWSPQHSQRRHVCRQVGWVQSSSWSWHWVRTAVIFELLYLIFFASCEFATTIFPVQAPLPVTLNAPSMAFLLFIRTFASVSLDHTFLNTRKLTNNKIWGITIGSTVLENRLKSLLPNSLLSQLPRGVSVTYALIPQISSLSPPVAELVREAFAKSLRLFWHVFIGIAGLGLVSSLFMKGVPLPSFTDEKWDIQQNLERAADADAEIVNEKVSAKEKS